MKSFTGIAGMILLFTATMPTHPWSDPITAVMLICGAVMMIAACVIPSKENQ